MCQYFSSKKVLCHSIQLMIDSLLSQKTGTGTLTDTGTYCSVKSRASRHVNKILCYTSIMNRINSWWNKMYRNTVCLEDIDITKAQVSRKSAHTIYYNCLDQRSRVPISTIVKLNKSPGQSGEEHSLLEVIASDLTRFYMGSSLTSSQDLILDTDRKSVV